MQVEELLELAQWYVRWVGGSIIQKYQAVSQPIEYNASQSQKQPVLPAVETLEAELATTDLSHLTVEQVRKLAELEVMQYLGLEGSAFLAKTIRTEQFDPSTAAERLRTAIGKLSDVSQRFQQLVSALRALEYDDTLYEPEDHEAIIRVHFRGEAGINDVQDWKKWSADWYDIARGLALVVSEKPADVRVLGANTGSVIMILSGTIMFVTVLAIVVKRLSGIVKEGLEIANTVEDLRHKKFLNREIETQLTALRQQKEENGIKEAIDAVREKLGRPIQAEMEATVENAIKKYFNFYNKGGEVDFIAPVPDEAANDADVPEAMKQIRELNETVQEIRSNQDALRLLTHNLTGTNAAE